MIRAGSVEFCGNEPEKLRSCATEQLPPPVDISARGKIIRSIQNCSRLCSVCMHMSTVVKVDWSFWFSVDLGLLLCF